MEEAGDDGAGMEESDAGLDAVLTVKLAADEALPIPSFHEIARSIPEFAIAIGPAYANELDVGLLPSIV